ncbi:hypothetical protein ACWDSL_24280 [Streptomyces sp. NPDC000941]
MDVARDQEEADRAIEVLPPDLLISDITRGSEQEGGLEHMERLRREGYDGQLIFFTSRVTPARQARARELAALGVTSDPQELLLLADLAAARHVAAPHPRSEP